jgi:hypothetical protein
MAAPARRNDLIGGIGRLIRDLYTVLADGLWWGWTRLWRLNRGLARTFLPGQGKPVHTVVALVAVVLEFVGLWVAAVNFAATH